MEKNFTQEDIKKFQEAIRIWNENAEDLGYWLTNYGHSYSRDWIANFGSASTASPAYILHMVDSFVKWIEENVL